MSNIEFEHSFKVSDLKPFLAYCEENGYKKISQATQNRIVYENANDSKIIARLTTETTNNKTVTTLDFKNVNSKQGDLNISAESVPMIVDSKNKEAVLSILNTYCLVSHCQ